MYDYGVTIVDLQDKGLKALDETMYYIISALYNAQVNDYGYELCPDTKHLHIHAHFNTIVDMEELRAMQLSRYGFKIDIQPIMNQMQWHAYIHKEHNWEMMQIHGDKYPERLAKQALYEQQEKEWKRRFKRGNFFRETTN